jgi:hypothetical protein
VSALAVSTTAWWVIGWILAGAVVVIAAALLLIIIALGRRIVRQAEQIVAALGGARENTNGLWDVTKINLVLDQITRRLAAVREGLGT